MKILKTPHQIFRTVPSPPWGLRPQDRGNSIPHEWDPGNISFSYCQEAQTHGKRKESIPLTGHDIFTAQPISHPGAKKLPNLDALLINQQHVNAAIPGPALFCLVVGHRF
jgi:hypothetical protein